MDSDAASNLSLPPPSPPREYSAPSGGETPDPEEYETASDPDVDDTDSSAVTEKALSPEENAPKSSPETGDQNTLYFDEGESHGSSRNGILRENSDSSGNPNEVFLGVGEKVEEGEEGENISPIMQNPIGSNNSVGGDVAKSTENGVGESQAERNENLGRKNEHSSFDAGASQELEHAKLGDGDSSVAAMELNSSESGLVDSASLDVVEPKAIESNFFVSVTGEVGDDAQQRCGADVEGNDKSVNLDVVLPADSDVLEDNYVGAVVSGTLEKEAETYADGAENFESLVADDNDSKSTDTGRELEVLVDDEKKPAKPVEVDAIDEDGLEGSYGEVNAHKGDSPEFNFIDSNDEVVGRGLVEIPENVNAIEISKSSIPSQEIVNEAVFVGSENVSSPGQAGLAVHLTADDVDLKSSLEAVILPVIAKETVVGDDTTQGTRTDRLPQMIYTDKLDCNLPKETAEEKVVVGSEDAPCSGEGEPAVQSNVVDGDLNSVVVRDENAREINTEILPKNINIDKEKVVVASEDDPRSDEDKLEVQLNAVDGDLNSAIELETLPIITKETVVGDGNTKETTTESLPQKSNTDKLDGTSLNQQTPEYKVMVGSEHASSHGDGEPAFQFTADDHDSNPAVEVETLPVTAAKKTGARDESLPEVLELGQKVETDVGEYQVTAAEEVKDVADVEDRKISDGPESVAILDSSEAAKQIIGEIERISSSSQSAGLQGSRDYSTSLDGQIVSDSDEVLDSDEDGDGGELFDSAALAALLKAASGSSDGTVTVTAQDAARIFSGDRPVGLGTSAPSLRPAAPRSTRPSLFTPSEISAVEEPDHHMDDDEKRLHEKVEQIRVKFLRLVHRLGHSPADAVVGQVLYRLSLAEGIKQGRQMSRTFNIENTKKQALLLEEKGKDDLDFSCNILVLGKTGVGKSATINSIFGEEMSRTNPFQLATASVRVISGLVDGVRVRVIDTPGLKASIMDQAANRKVLSSIKKFTKKCPPDIVLYVDRMDTQTRDFNDMPLLRSITSILGPSIWFNAIVALTHASSAPPDGPNGSPLGYEVFVTQRSHVVQQSVRQAAGDMRLMNPVALIENHPSCRRNREGERVLPNGLSWRPQLLLLSYASKILSEANSLLKFQESSGKLFAGFRLRSPPLPFLLSSLLQSRAHPKLSGDHGGDNADSDIDPDEFSDAEQDEEVDEYDQLPPFTPLRKSQIFMLTKEQKKAYFDEYDYRVKLLQKKQWKEELRRMKETKKKGKVDPDEFTNGVMPEDYDQDGSPAAVQVPLPDMVLPPSFDCDNPAFRYRLLEPTSQILTRPVLDTHGWDHDCGYDGISIEESLAIASQFPTSMAVQITKDKKEFNIHLDSSVAVKHGEHGSTLAGFDIQSVGKQLAYILRGETKFNNLKKNKTAAGMSVTFLGETVATGLKLEDRILIGKRLGLVASTGAVRAQGDVAYGANLEVRLKDKDYPIGQALSTLGLSLMKWRSDLALGANLQSQYSVGRNSKMAVRVGLNNKLTGQITVRTSTSDQLQIAFAGIIPLAIFIYRNIKSNESYMDH